MEIANLRQEIGELLGTGQFARAAGRLAALWHHEAGPALAGYVVSTFEKMRGKLELRPYRCVILRSFTVEPMMPILKACAFIAGIDLAVNAGQFNAYAQELVDQNSGLYSARPDAVILAVQTRDIAPQLGSERAAAETVERVTQDFAAWIRSFRARTDANLIIHSLEAPILPSEGIYNSQLEEGEADTIHQLNRALRRLAGQYRGVYILDYDGLVARHGRERWCDERKWLSVRLPIAASNLAAMAHEWMRYLAPLAGRVAKAIAVDLDNTLWGGVIGEDGMSGIQLGPEYPGAAYQALQRTLLDLTRRGILLAVCSKNDPQDAREALAGHPGMLLRPEHFAAVRINWNEKSENLREIAAELNIGLDSIAFLDDNPVERQQVRDETPEAMVLELPDDPMGFARAVRDYPAFERLALAAEDRQRTGYYAAERERAALEQSAGTREDFYRSLKQEVEVSPVDRFTLARVAQLTQKTNQFNLTMKRYTEQQIEELARRPGWRVLALKLRDRYADNGVVGVAITHDAAEVCRIDTFLLSCRVIGRTVETALLAHLAEAARERGLRRLEGWFIPTKRNAPAKDFYRAHGFAMVAAADPDGTPAGLWEAELTGPKAVRELRCPEWVQLIAPVAEKA
jgi:FkbH-like protein